MLAESQAPFGGHWCALLSRGVAEKSPVEAYFLPIENHPLLGSAADTWDDEIAGV